MSQESFVLAKDLNFNDAGFQAKAGDVLVFTPPEKLVIYRGGDLAARIGFHKVSLDGLVLTGILLPEKKAKGFVAPAPEPVAPAAPVATEPTTVVNPQVTDAITTPAPAADASEPVGTEPAVVAAPVADAAPADAAPVEAKAPEVTEPKAEKKAAKAEPKAAEPAKKTKK